MSSPIRILALPCDSGGCGWYRVRQPLAMIQNHTEHDAYIIDPHKDDMSEVVMAARHAHIVVARPGSEQGMAKMKEMPEFSHLKWVMDIDDNVEIISPYSTHYEEYGVEDYYDENLDQWLWRDGERGFDKKKNLARMQRHIQGIKDVDLVTVTTKKLADYARQYNKNVAILPNSVDLDKWWKLPLKKNKKPRVGWSGGISHYEDWYSIKEPLNELMRELQFTLVMAGQHFDGIIDDDNKHLVELHDWVPFKGHSYRMMCMNLDAAIIPLADLPFNHYKSPIKLLEMSAMGVPSVVANVTPYKEEIDRSDAFWGYSSPTQFIKTLKGLLSPQGSHGRGGDKARKYVEKHYDAKKNAQMWVDAYKSLL